jgi:micrococcal nuclease
VGIGGPLFLLLVVLSALGGGAEEEPDPTSAEAPAATTTTSVSSPATTSVPSTAVTATSVPQAAAATYVVKAGDTIGAICSAQLPVMETTTCVAAIVATNKLAGADQLAVGQSLVMPPAMTQGPVNPSQTLAPSGPPGTTTAIVARVIDGDTIELQGGLRVRYIGMDTPETVDPGQPVGCYGPEASARNKALVEGKTVQLEKDVSETDRYGRLLRYVYLNGVMINEQLVAEGYAMSSTYPPDVKYQDRILAAQQAARNANRGLWADCQTSAPVLPAATATTIPAVTAPASQSQAQPGQCAQGCPSPPPGCVIKGNISTSTKEKIYHVPGQQNYDDTIIDPSLGERWFCTAAEAQANGWRAALR